MSNFILCATLIYFLTALERVRDWDRDHVGFSLLLVLAYIGLGAWGVWILGDPA